MVLFSCYPDALTLIGLYHSNLNFPRRRQQSTNNDSYPYSIEKKDGSISKQSIQLGLSPFQILERMAASINFSPPPPPQASPLSAHTSPPRNKGEEFKQPITNQNGAFRNEVDQFIWAHGWTSYHRKSPSSTNRNLLHFLQNVDFKEIKQRKLDRINATAAALVARRAFKFAAVDGTGMGWSSATLVICLSRLTSLHDEHHSLLIKSFYPFRMVISADEFQNNIDLYGGIIRLNPAATPLQWVGTLMTVTDDSVAVYKKHQIELKRNLSKVESALGLRLVAGHSCQPEEYHRCVGNLAMEFSYENNSHGLGKSVLAVAKANLIIESSQSCRRGRLRKDGIEVGANMNLNGIRKTIGEFASRSNEYIQMESEKRKMCKEICMNFMHEFGVQRVTKVSSLVASDQMSECLAMLLNKNEAEKEVLRGYLAGQSIGVAGRGHLCHLGDDGSIIIPTNCS